MTKKSPIATRHVLPHLRCSSTTAPDTKSQLKINLAGDTAFTVKHFTLPAAVELGAEINKLVGAFKVRGRHHNLLPPAQCARSLAGRGADAARARRT